MKRIFQIVAVSAALNLAAVALAVSPQRWQQRTEADFATGEFFGTVLSSRGQLRLSRGTEILLPAGTAPAVVADVAEVGGRIYAASFDDPQVWVLPAEGPAEAIAVPGDVVCALLAERQTDSVLAATGGEGAGVYRITAGGAVEPLWQAGDSADYVWALAPAGEGACYAATGRDWQVEDQPAGVWRIESDGTAARIFSVGDLADNVLCLAVEPGGRILAGTDREGLVFAVEPDTGSGRILLDADQQEISAIVPDGSGGLFVSTCDIEQIGEPTPQALRSDEPGRAAGVEQPDHRPDPMPEEQPSVEGPGDPQAAPAADPDGSAEPARGERSQEAAVAEETSAADSDGDPAPAPAAETRPTEAASAAASPASAGPSPAAGENGQAGNAIYYIGPDGLVRTVLARPVAFLDMVLQGQRLILATGDRGEIFSVDVSGDDLARLCDLESAYVTALDLPAGDDGEVLFGTAGEGAVGRLLGGLVSQGEYVSQVFDAAQIARWGTLSMRVSGSSDAVRFSTRSGNVQDPDLGGWSDWSPQRPAGEGYMKIASPSARFLQYRLVFAGGTSPGPAVGSVELIYQVGNLPPHLEAVTIADANACPDNPSEKAPSRCFRVVTIAASDLNEDTLAYTIHVRPLGQEPWVRLCEEISEAVYCWDTRTVEDGVYELRVLASDAPANPPGTGLSAARISKPVPVDNTPPRIRFGEVRERNGALVVDVQIEDDASRLVRIEYALDGDREFIPLAGDDGIIDSPRESVSIRLEDLEPGPHRLSVRATDVYENVRYGSLLLHGR